MCRYQPQGWTRMYRALICGNKRCWTTLFWSLLPVRYCEEKSWIPNKNMPSAGKSVAKERGQKRKIMWVEFFSPRNGLIAGFGGKGDFTGILSGTDLKGAASFVQLNPAISNSQEKWKIVQKIGEFKAVDSKWLKKQIQGKWVWARDNEVELYIQTWITSEGAV